MESTRFSGGRSRNGNEASVLGLPGPVLAVVEEEGVEVVVLLQLTWREDAHGVLSTAALCRCASVQRETKRRRTGAERGKEESGGGERRWRGSRVRARAAGGLLVEGEKWRRGPRGGGGARAPSAAVTLYGRKEKQAVGRWAGSPGL